MHLTMDHTRAVQADRLREAAAYRLAAEARRSRPRARWRARPRGGSGAEPVAPRLDGCVAC